MRAILSGIAIGSMIFAMPAMAQETRLAEGDIASPPATLDQMEWLIGQWTGVGIQGAPAMESWLPPSGGTMVGTFVQETPEGAIMFTEHLYLLEEEGTIVLRLKHFNADLTGWEEKDGMLTFRLIAIEPCAAYFNALTLRCADPANPGAGIVAAVRMKSDKPTPQELVFRLNGLPDVAPRFDCDGTTLAMNECLMELRSRAEEREADYFTAALENSANTPELAERMQQSQAAADEYRNRECGAVYENWKSGSIRNIMSLTCSIRLIDQRTHDIWKNWLTFMDSTPPVRPEPAPTR